MGEDADGILVPFDFKSLIAQAPILKALPLKVTVISFDKPIDSSDIHPAHWQRLGEIILTYYDSHDGFIVLHGTDTMAYTSSALSFLLRGLKKPVILTGAQIPITKLRTDARDNLVTALEIAASKNEIGEPVVREVCIYFDHFLLRGNRAQKVQSNLFDAFNSTNYPVLAESGIEITYFPDRMLPYHPDAVLDISSDWSSNVALIKLFPGIQNKFLASQLLDKNLGGAVIETFGMGNAMDEDWFLGLLDRAIKNGALLMNVSQCPGGEVVQGKYKTSAKMKDLGVISGRDITPEAAITKMMYVLGQQISVQEQKAILENPLSGEMT